MCVHTHPHIYTHSPYIYHIAYCVPCSMLSAMPILTHLILIKIP